MNSDADPVALALSHAMLTRADNHRGTVKLFEEAGIIERHDFRDGRARFEEATDDHHDHLINVKSGEVIEFVNEEIERLQVEIARKLGYKLVDHRMELYGVPLDEDETS